VVKACPGEGVKKALIKARKRYDSGMTEAKLRFGEGVTKTSESDAGVNES
jgi:hypothetical protein